MLERFMSSKRVPLWLGLVIEGIILYAILADHIVIGQEVFIACLIPALMVYELSTHFQNPKNWWAAFWGVTVDVNLDRFQEYQTRGDVLRDEIKAWLVQTNLKPHFQPNAFRHIFLRKKHATMFKLAWG